VPGKCGYLKLARTELTAIRREWVACTNSALVRGMSAIYLDILRLPWRIARCITEGRNERDSPPDVYPVSPTCGQLGRASTTWSRATAGWPASFRAASGRFARACCSGAASLLGENQDSRGHACRRGSRKWHLYAKAGDSVYFHTSFPIPQNNHVIIPVGSYLRGELIESKRPGRVKGRGEFRMRLDTLIFPNGYTVDLNATPRTADSGGKETMDSEGKITGGSGKGKDAQTVAETTAAGAGIGAIADGVKGLGIGAGIGAVAGLGAVLLTRGPEAELPRGSTLDIVLEHELALDGSQIQYTNVGQAQPITPPPAQPR